MAIRKFGAALAAIGMVASAMAQAPDTYTLTVPASSLKKALEALSAQGGPPMFAAGSLGDEFVTLRLKNASRAEVQRKLAETFQAEWIQEKNGIRLVRTTAIEKGIRERHIERLAKEFGEVLAKKRKEIETVKPLDESEIAKLAGEVESLSRPGTEQPGNWEKLRRIQDRFPSSQVASRILLLMDPKQLASIDPTSRVVLSTHPTPMQMPAPRGVEQIVASAMSQQLRLAEAVKGVIDEDSPNSWMFDGLTRRDLEGRVAKTLVVLSRPAWSQGLSIEVRVVNHLGNYMFSANSHIGNNRFEGSEELIATSPKQDEKGDEPIKLGEIQNRIFEFVKKIGTGGSGRLEPLSPELRDVISDPLKYEPLAYGFGDFVVAIAERQNLNLVAAPTDMAALMGVYAGIQGAPTVGKVKRILASRLFGLKAIEGDGWWTLRAEDLAESRQEFLPRSFCAALATLLRNASSATLDQWANLAALHAEDPTQKPMFMLLTILSMNDLSEVMNYAQGWNRLRFYGLLAPAQRQALLAGRPLAFGSLTLDQRSAVSRIVYRDDPMLEGRMENRAPVPDDDEPTGPELMTEPTEHLPSGIPSGASISLRVQEQSGYFIEYTAMGHASTMFGNVDQIAWHLFEKENPEPQSPWEQSMEYKTFQNGRQRDLGFVVVLSPSMQKSWQLQDQVRTSDARKMTFEQLPDNVRAEIKKKVEEIRKSQTPPDDGPPPQCLIFGQ